ncbi:hypothetical protein EX30DRAFT_394574 [Ascodesmis nigricans]|uniref:ARM repeat-containing protein n=1 Tax=Ascodesmis nigricans TaxID=341454 RepID=A0A4V3SJB4_9PEZI|nr:hypothetical protein EX30DRAFT_394574 [Ascodesmis nigricans]
MAEPHPPLELACNILSQDKKDRDSLLLVVESLNALKDDRERLLVLSKDIWIASREESWRIPFGESGILEFFQSLLPELKDEDGELRLNALKILGNSCSDKDANRERMIAHPDSLRHIINTISCPESGTIAAIVLHNIITDYDPAQLAAIQHGAVPVIFDVLSSQSLEGPINHLLRTLELLLSHDAGKDAAPQTAPGTLIQILLIPDDEGQSVNFDNALSIIAILSTLLTSSTMQAGLLKSSSGDANRGFPGLLTALEWSFDNISPDTSTEERKKKDLGLIRHARNQLVECIGEVAASPEFLKTFPLNSPVIQRVKDLLQVQAGKEELTIASCIAIGNIGRSDEICTALVQDLAIQTPILRIIEQTIDAYDTAVKAIRSKSSSSSSSTEIDPSKALEAVRVTSSGAMSISILHSAVGVLKNLAIPQPNKTALVEAGTFVAIRRMLLLSGVATGQVYYAAISLARLLVVENRANIEVMLTIPEQKDTSDDTAAGKSTFALILDHFTPEADAPTKTELARLVVATLRCSYRDSTGSMRTIKKLMEYEVIGDIVWWMVSQDAYPTVRSDGWFAMAVLSTSAEGLTWIKNGIEKVWPSVSVGGKEKTEGTETEVKELDEKDSKEEVKDRTGEDVMWETIRRGGREAENVAYVANECGRTDMVHAVLKASGSG